MFKIGDFSKLGQVTTRMLRHYDKLGLLVPNHTDEWSGYRYYTIQQLPRLHRIIALKDMGLSLQQIAALLANDEQLPTEQLRGMLALKRSEIAEEMQAMEQQLAQVEARLAQLDQQDAPSRYEIVVKSIPALPVASIRQTVPHIAEMGFYCESLTHALYRKLRAARVKWAGPELTLYHADEYRETDLDVEVGVGLPRALERPANADASLVFRELPGREQVAALIYEGEFNEVTPAVLELLRWTGLQQHVPDGPLRQLHLSGPAHPETGSAESPIIEIQLPIAKAQLGPVDRSN